MGDVLTGVSLKHAHLSSILCGGSEVDFFEVHAENYMMDRGAAIRCLHRVRERHELSVHGVGMSLGSADGLDPVHVRRLARLVERFRPRWVSEHLAWCRVGGTYLNDLLPLPLTEESLAVMSANVSRLQDAIRRPILIENPSSYLEFSETRIDEVEFLSALCDATDCGLLVDVNNLFVSAQNLGWDAGDYVDRIPGDRVGEVHLAGHRVRDADGMRLWVDDHGSAVTAEVWTLYSRLIERIGPRPTLVEWDNRVPELSVLEDEAARARAVLEACACPT